MHQDIVSVIILMKVHFRNINIMPKNNSLYHFRSSDVLRGMKASINVLFVTEAIEDIVSVIILMKVHFRNINIMPKNNSLYHFRSSDVLRGMKASINVLLYNIGLNCYLGHEDSKDSSCMQLIRNTVFML
ncbi:hypothetical protein C0J52_17967 [Blattella germanica]|nr:hypothetical protein C0J52_17967 [Blattella germanica]